MTFKEVLKQLNIEEYEERIINSNSKGELFHCADYILIAEKWGSDDLHLFRDWFVGMVKWAEDTWDRPESIFQHVLRQLGA